MKLISLFSGAGGLDLGFPVNLAYHVALSIKSALQEVGAL